MPGLKSLVKQLEDHHRTAFAKEFLALWSEVGFGAFGKRDTELLLFHSLEQAVKPLPDRPKTNYEWARTLRITPKRVRNLRRDAYMRFGNLLSDKQGKDLIAQAITAVDDLHVDLSSDGGSVVKLVADDPVVEIELQPKLREVGGHYTFESNRQILCIPLHHFLALVDHVLDVDGDVTFRALLDLANDAEDGTSSFQSEMARAAWADRTEGEKAMHFLKFLVNTFAPAKASELLEYLDNIRGSQRYYPDRPDD